LLPSLKASQCSLRNIPFDFWQTWEVAEICREAWFNDPEIKLDLLMAQHGIDLDDKAKGKLKTAIEYAVEKMD